jgi:hypothetical protein
MGHALEKQAGCKARVNQNHLNGTTNSGYKHIAVRFVNQVLLDFLFQVK